MPALRRTAACFALFWAGLGCLPAQTVTVHPVEASGPLSNPLMGFRPDIGSVPSRYAYPTLVRHYIRWNQIENNQSDTVQKIRDYCNAQWAALPELNQKVIPRVYLDWDSAIGNEYWPADLQTGDWSSQAFKDRVVRLIGRLGEVWDNDPRVAWVQVGIIGYWGEQENPVSVSQDGWAQRLGDAFKAAFKNKKYLVRNLNHFSAYEVGTYWDSFAHPSQANVRNTINTFNAQGRYLGQVIEGEVAYNWGESTFDPKFGGEPEITLNSTVYTDNMIDVIRELHCTALGWIASYRLDGRHGSNPDTVRANAARMQKEFGYRFVIPEFSCTARTEPGAALNVSFKVKNVGAAPFYENWPVAIVLINPTTRQTVWQVTLSGTDTRTWVPGDNYSYTTRTYQTPAPERLISASVIVPATLATGEYLVGLSILEPTTGTPGVFFAVPNFFKESQTQPLCRIGIGVTAGSHALTGISFDDLVNDDARYYSLDQAPAITTQPQSLIVAPGSSVQFSVAATGTPPLSYQWKKGGVDIGGATSTSYSIAATVAGDAGSYTVVVTNSAGSVESSAAVLTVEPIVPPSISSHPTIQTAVIGSDVTFSVTATGTAPFTHQWKRNGENVGGATEATLVVSDVQPGAGATYTVVVTNAAGSVTSDPATLALDTTPRLVNVSCLGSAGAGDSTLIAGFYIKGSGSKTLLIRGVGARLAQDPFNLPNTVADPQISLYDKDQLLIATNDDWDSSLAPDFARAGAFALVAGSKDAAMKTPLASPGLYTVHLVNNGPVADAIIEVYDFSRDQATRLTNVSSRLNMKANEIVTLGTALIANPVPVLARAIGPGLAPYILEPPSVLLADPFLRVFVNQVEVASNDDWSSTLAPFANAVGAFPIATGSTDAVARVTASTGSLTIQTTGKGGTGVAIIELWESQEPTP